MNFLVRTELLTGVSEQVSKFWSYQPLLRHVESSARVPFSSSQCLRVLGQQKLAKLYLPRPFADGEIFFSS